MELKKTIQYCLVVAILGTLAGCNSANKWKVEGKISNADNRDIIVEMSENGYWFPLDTLTTDKSGNFSYSHTAIGYPEILRLRMGDKNIYFPIDSIETINITSSLDNFGTDYNVSGSQSANTMMEVDKKIKELVSAKGSETALNDSILKRELGSIILSNPSGIVSYYIINKTINGKPVFNPADKRDVRIIGAVANAFNEFRPNDPRTKYLKTIFLANRPLYQNSSAPTDTIQVKELNFFEIDLSDNTGKQNKLSDIVSKNKVVVLNFTAYTAQQSPAFNIGLAEMYEKYHNQNVEIFQVAIDPDEYQWKQTAKNLPWITVYNPSTSSDILRKYNVNGIPTTYIIANGELVKRVDDVTKISSEVAKYL